MNAPSRPGAPRKRPPSPGTEPGARAPRSSARDDFALELSGDAVEALTDADLEAALAEASAHVGPRIRRPVLPPPPPSAAAGLHDDDHALTIDVAELARQLEEEEKARGAGRDDDGPGVVTQEIEALFEEAAAGVRQKLSDDDPSLAFPEPPPPPPPPAPAKDRSGAAAQARIALLDRRVKELTSELEEGRRDLVRARQETREARDRAETARAQLEVYQGRLVKLGDEFERLRKRADRDREEAVRYGVEKLLKELLAVLDNLERAIAHGDEPGASAAALSSGVRMTLDQWTAVLRKHGVARLDVERGAAFDPAWHEAMDQVADADLPAGSIARVLQHGFVLHDRLLRPAMVVVATGPVASAGTTDEAEAAPDGAADGAAG